MARNDLIVSPPGLAELAASPETAAEGAGQNCLDEMGLEPVESLPEDGAFEACLLHLAGYLPLPVASLRFHASITFRQSHLTSSFPRERAVLRFEDDVASCPVPGSEAVAFGGGQLAVALAFAAASDAAEGKIGVAAWVAVAARVAVAAWVAAVVAVASWVAAAASTAVVVGLAVVASDVAAAYAVSVDHSAAAAAADG